jgi:hypothetical protein
MFANDHLQITCCASTRLLRFYSVTLDMILTLSALPCGTLLGKSHQLLRSQPKG